MRLSSPVRVAAIALSLYGCAGGGSSTSSTPLPAGNPVPPTPTVTAPNPPPPFVDPAAAFRTPEYSRMGALDTVRAAEAYALGFTGTGTIIGIVDFNFDFSSGEVNYHSASVGADASAIAIYEAQFGEPNDPAQHGHAVAAVAAARKNDTEIHGVAFNATVLAVDYFSRVNETDYNFNGVPYHISDPFTYLTSRGARIVNISFGYDAEAATGLKPTATEVYGIDTPAIAVDNGALLVVAAGNNSKAEPSTSVYDIVGDLQQAGIYNTGPGAFIIAGAVITAGATASASFSNRAGSLAEHYLMAPGVGLTVPWNGNLGLISGTSFSTAIVSGAAAIVLGRWPSLTAMQAADILLQSATDLGAAGTDAIYGRGLLNIAGALQPLGTTTFAVPNGAGATVNSTGLILGSAFGDAPAFRAALQETTILDGYGRDYTYNLSGMAEARPPGTDIYGAMRQRLGWNMGGLPIFSTSQLDLGYRANPTDGIRSFGPAGGIEASLADRYAIARFAGEKGRASWVAGTGLSLRDALVPYDNGNPFAALSLAQGFSSSPANMVSSFAGMGLALDTATRLSFGVARSVNQGIAGAYLPPQFHNTGVVTMMRLDRRTGNGKFGVELGGLMEDGGSLGSLASGGLKIADTSATSWVGASYEAPVLFRWAFKGSMTLSATAANRPMASLINSTGPVYATSYALGLGKRDAIVSGDAFSFAISQPLRAESAPVALTLGAGRDPASGGLLLRGIETSFLPSGRQIDLEAGYGLPLGDWNGGVNLSFSRDAGHVGGLNAATGMVWLTRRI
jgi:hypothetical protein